MFESRSIQALVVDNMRRHPTPGRHCFLDESSSFKRKCCDSDQEENFFKNLIILIEEK
jgi:hypothetical protein